MAIDNNILTSLRLQNYRSYNDYAVEFSEGVNIVVGPNGCGKTNMLESLLLLCGIKPYRARYIDTVQKGADWSRIEGTYNSFQRIVKIKKVNNSVDRSYIVKNTPKKRLSFENILPVVLFEPEHMRFITGSPERRRQFMDVLLSSTDAEYAKSLKAYLRVLAQRNALLKAGQNSDLFVWDIRLSELAGQLVNKRLQLIKEINLVIKEIYSEIAQSKQVVSLDYLCTTPQENYESKLVRLLESQKQQDLLRGYTPLGPHRDDISVLLNNNESYTTASRGETRTLILCLKIIEYQLLIKYRNQKPILLLDDVFSELDGARRKSLTGYLENTQTIITTTDADVIRKNFAQNTNLIGL